MNRKSRGRHFVVLRRQVESTAPSAEYVPADAAETGGLRNMFCLHMEEETTSYRVASSNGVVAKSGQSCH